MKLETLEEIIERMTQDCRNEVKHKNSSSCDTEEVIKIKKYQRISINKIDDENR